MTLSWTTASDWDTEATASGAVHESFGDRDAAQVARGTPSTGFGNGTLDAYWPLDDDSGTDIAEVSGNSANGTLDGGTLGATGVFGTTAISFSGSGEYIICDSPSITGEITVAAWINPDTLPSSQAKVVSGPFDGTNTAWELGINEGNDNLFVGSHDGTTYRATASNSNISTDTWTHFAGRYDGSQWDLYLDGSNATESRTSDQSTGAVSATGNRAIAAMHKPGSDPSYDDYFPGQIDEVQVYSTGLSETQIATLAGLDWSYTSTFR